MKKFVWVTVTAFVLAAGFSGCADDDQPGNQAGYAGDGTNDCSAQLVADYDTLTSEITNAQTLVSQVSMVVGSALESDSGLIQTAQNEIDTANSDLSAFNANYEGVSCSAQHLDGSGITIDSNQMSELSDEIATAQTNLDTYESASAPIVNYNPAPVVGYNPTPVSYNPAPVVGNPIAMCEGTAMFEEYLQLDTNVTQLQTQLTKDEAITDQQQKLKALNGDKAKVQTYSAQLTAFNQKYTGTSCELGQNDGVLTVTSLSGSLTTTLDQLSEKIQKDLTPSRPGA